MKEDELLANVLELCGLLHVRTAHFRPAQTSHGWRTAVSGDGAGWPDLVIVGRRVIYRELKTDVGRLRPDQRTWIAALLTSGQDIDIWRPKDWRSGRITNEIKDIA